MAGKTAHSLQVQLRMLVSIAMLFALVLSSMVLAQTELVMVEQEGCPYCAKFNREIAAIYPKTDEGRRAPLRRIDIYDGWPSDLAKVQAESLTPTFILVDDGQEVGRLRGYRGDEYFWFLLGELLEKLPESELPRSKLPESKIGEDK